MTANTKADVNQATAGAAGATVGADQQTAGAGARVADFSEIGHKMMSDTNVEELIALLGVARGQMSQNAQAKLDEVFLTHMQTTLSDEREHKANIRAVTLDRLASLNTTSKLGDDRMWNINETDAYSVQGIKAVADILKGD
jgi:hypothetical protein